MEKLKKYTTKINIGRYEYFSYFWFDWMKSSMFYLSIANIIKIKI